MEGDEKRLIIAVFILSTVFFLWQHGLGLFWDFSVYVLNAKYFLANGSYFEISRPPLVPFLIGLLGFGGWKAAESFFVVFVSALFCYSSVKFADAVGFDRLAFYALSLSPYVLLLGLVGGTELLMLSLVELGLICLIKDSPLSGLFFGLAALAKYTGLPLVFLGVLHSSFRKRAASLGLFAASLFPWLAYSYLEFGNLFTSIADQYAGNVLFRTDYVQPISLSHFVEIQGLLLPLFLIGACLALAEISRVGIRESFRKKKVELLMFIVFVYSIVSFNAIPFKITRYLFLILVPTFYFSYRAVEFGLKGDQKKIVAVFSAVFIVGFLFSVGAELVGMKSHESLGMYRAAVEVVGEFGFENCSFMSNSWAILNYMGVSSKPFPGRGEIEFRISQGEKIALFTNVDEPAYSRDDVFISSLPVLFRDRYFILLGERDSCLERQVCDEGFISSRAEAVLGRENRTINQNPCFVLFRQVPFGEELCNFVNLNGFGKDENREFV